MPPAPLDAPYAGSDADLQRRLMLQRVAALAGSATLLGACGGGGGDGGSPVPAPTPTTAPAPTPAPTPTPAPSPTPAPTPAPTGTPSAPPLPPTNPPPPVPQVAARPAWADAVPANTWHRLPGTAFMPWARTHIPAGAYRGTDPLGSIVNAFCDPAFDGNESAQYFFGGGHGDGSCNAVIRFDHQTLQWQLVGQPTPPSVYLPEYLQTTAPINYPSGTPFAGWFLSAAELPAAADAAYRAPALARVSTHMYAAAAKRGDVVHHFYLSYGEFNVRSGTWSGRDVDLGQQLLAFRTPYGAVPLQQGTVAIYDEVTDRFFVTLNPGDSGGGWRNGLLVFDPNTRRIDSVHEVDETWGRMDNSLSIAKVGRSLYIFQKVGNYAQPTVMNTGVICNMDQLAAAPRGSLQPMAALKFRLVGDTAGSTFPFSSTQETIPCWYDGVAIRRWNYGLDVNRIYSVPLAPTGGAGTLADPLLLQQTSTALAGTGPTRPMFVYSRFVFHNGARCALFIPEATADWLVLKLA